MTLIAAICDPSKGETWIGADSMSANGGTKMFTARKWTVRKPWAVGAAGDNRTNNIIAAHADDLLDGLTGAFDFTLRMRGLIEKDGYSGDQEPGPKAFGQQMILAHPGGVWSICPGFSIVEVPDGELWADGSGRAYGLGAGHACVGTPRAKLRAALAAAIRYCDSCGGPVFIDRIRA